MSRWTLVILGLLVALLGWTYLREEEKAEQRGLHVVQPPLVVGFSADRVSAIRIDNLERSVNVKLERDAAGAWFMTDPIPYPAQGAVIRQLLQTLTNALGEPVVGVDPAEVHLDRPLVVLELTQIEHEGPHTYRVELGAVDLDEAKIYVRVPDHPSTNEGSSGVFRTVRTLYTTLDRNPDDYRDPRATHLLAHRITSFRRRGELLDPDGKVRDLTFDALLEPEGWKKVDPPVVTLDPNAIALLLRGSAELRVEHFAADLPESMSFWGLDPPAFTVELMGDGNDTVVLEFGRPELIGPAVDTVETWFCRRAGFPHVWEVSGRTVELLTLPPSTLYEPLLVRAHRDDVQAVALQGAEKLLLERASEGWTVRVDGSETRYRADAGSVDDVLGVLEKAQLGAYAEGESFLPSMPEQAIQITTRVGGGPEVKLGGRIGASWRDPETGASGRLFLRTGDEVSALIEDAVAELTSLGVEDLRSPRIHRLSEVQVKWIKLRHAGREMGFVHQEDDWRIAERDFGAPEEFLVALDRLLSLQATRWLDGPPPDVTDEVEVDVKQASRPLLHFRVGRLGDGTTVVEEEGRWAVADAEILATGGDLHEALLEILGAGESE